MEFIDLVLERRSIRKFKAEPIDKETILEIISTAIQAPSAGNEQMWHFIVVTNENDKKQMADIVKNKIERLAFDNIISIEQLKSLIKAATFFMEAPAVIAVISKYYRSKVDQMLKTSGYSDKDIDSLRARPDLQSIGAVIQTLLLAAWEKGYGTCWMTGPCVARSELEAFLGVSSPRTLAALIPIGIPEIIPKTRGRKDASEVTAFME